MSHNSPFSVDEYQMSISSPFSVDEYQMSPGALSPQSFINTMELSHQFSIEEYQDIEATMNPSNDIDAATSVARYEQNDVPKDCEDIISASPMHFRRVPRQNSRDRFALVTSENQLKLDVGKDCCARGCMATIGKEKLRAIRRYYFSLTGNEQDTYLTTKMQMVKDICSNIRISFEYYLFTGRQCCRVAFKIALCVSNMRLHRVQRSQR